MQHNALKGRIKSLNDFSNLLNVVVECNLRRLYWGWVGFESEIESIRGLDQNICVNFFTELPLGDGVVDFRSRRVFGLIFDLSNTL